MKLTKGHVNWFYRVRSYQVQILVNNWKLRDGMFSCMIPKIPLGLGNLVVTLNNTSPFFVQHLKALLLRFSSLKDKIQRKFQRLFLNAKISMWNWFYKRKKNPEDDTGICICLVFLVRSPIHLYFIVVKCLHKTIPSKSLI